MAQFEIYHNTNPVSRKETPFLLDIQSSEMTALPVSLLGTPVDSARDFRSEIIGAVDLLITGF